jgi:hypothetical protein
VAKAGPRDPGDDRRGECSTVAFDKAKSLGRRPLPAFCCSVVLLFLLLLLKLSSA